MHLALLWIKTSPIKVSDWRKKPNVEVLLVDYYDEISVEALLQDIPENKYIDVKVFRVEEVD